MTAVLLKSTIALLLALAAVSSSRRSRASLRHLVLAAMFVFLLLLPAVQRYAPAVKITVPSSVILSEAKDLPTRTGEGPLPSSPVRTTPENHALSGRTDWIAIAANIYLGGAALLLAYLLLGIVRLHRLAKRADVWLEGTARMNEIAHDANIRRPALVVLSKSVAVPLTFGFVRSTIVLPHEAQTWSADELARAVRHELEHVRREDWLLQLAARAACALYWPQPLVWIAWRRFCLEAERACDDAVLGGAEPEAYAGQLVSLARNVNRLSGVPVLAMASRSKLATRVDAILDGTQPRGPHGRSAGLAVLVALVALLASVAPVRVIAAATENATRAVAAAANISSHLGEALVKSAEVGDVENVQRLLDAGIDVNTIVPGDGTALIGAARGGQMEMIDFLIARGADPNVHSRGDGSPLTAAAREGHGELVELLLDRGARINDIVPGDENALMQASMHGLEELVRVLIVRGANVNARAIEGSRVRTPLRLARQYGHLRIERMLVAAGATD